MTIDCNAITLFAPERFHPCLWYNISSKLLKWSNHVVQREKCLNVLVDFDKLFDNKVNICTYILWYLIKHSYMSETRRKLHWRGIEVHGRPSSVLCTIRLILPDESKDEQLLRIERVSDLEVSLEESGQGFWEQEQGNAITLTHVLAV